MSSKFFSERGEKKIDDKLNTKNASSERTNKKKNNSERNINLILKNEMRLLECLF